MPRRYIWRQATPGSDPEHGDPKLITAPDADDLQAWIEAQIAAAVAAGPFPPGFIQGLVPANAAGDPTNDITFGMGSCRDSTDAANLVNPSAITKRADATWAAGTGNGGRASGAGSWGAGSWLLFALGKSSDPDAIDFGFDTSGTATNLLADAASGGWDLYRYVGALKTSGAAWPTFSAEALAGGGLEVLLSVQVLDVNTTGPGTSIVTVALSVPAGRKLRALLTLSLLDASGASQLIFTSSDQADTAPGANQFTLEASASSNRAQSDAVLRTDTSGQVRYRISASGSRTVKIFTKGWEDSRVG